MAHDRKKMAPTEYARMRNLSPQLLYYHIRQDQVKVDICDCGRKVIDIESTDKALKKKGVIK